MIQCECAFTYMNAVSGENLSGVFLSMKSTPVSRTTPGGAVGDVTDEARFCRTTALTVTRAAQSAARCTAAKSLTRKDIDQSI